MIIKEFQNVINDQDIAQVHTINLAIMTFGLGVFAEKY